MLTPMAIARNIQSVRKQSRKDSFFRCAGAHTRRCVTVEDLSGKPRSAVP